MVVFCTYVTMLRSIGNPVLRLGVSFLMCKASRMCKSDLLVVAIILKFCDCSGCPVSLECSRTAENGGDNNGRSVLAEIPLCSPTLQANWRRVDPKYRALQLIH